MKPQHFAVLAGSLLLVAVVLMITGRPTPSTPAVTALDHLVTVIGEGEVRVHPDQVVLTFGVVTPGPSGREAEALNVASVKRVRAALVAAGLDEDQVETSRREVVPDSYQDYAGLTHVTGFQARARITALLRVPSKVDAAVDAALGAGATSMDGIAYGVAGMEAARQSALAKALENARQRAAVVASADGGSLGDLKHSEVLADETGSLPVASSTVISVKVRVKATFGY